MLIILGTGPKCMVEFEKVREVWPDAMVMLLGHAAGLTRGEFLVSDHYENHRELINLQMSYNYIFTIHASASSSWRGASNYTDYIWAWPRPRGSSLETGIKIGKCIGFNEIIICGCPLEKSAMLHPSQVLKDGPIWPPPGKNKSSGAIVEKIRDSFLEFVRSGKWCDGVRSTSGYTKELLGGPEL